MDRAQGGEHYFDDLDEISALCEETGLKVVINTIPEGMPYWLTRQHPEARYRTSEGKTIEMSGAANLLSGGSPGLPGQGRGAGRDLPLYPHGRRALLEAQQVIAFDVWNELHLEPIFDYPGGCSATATIPGGISWSG